MSNLTDFFPSAGGGGLKPKFQEFTSSGTFTPSQALIDAGGYIEVFLVGGGQSGQQASTRQGGSGGETIYKSMYLNSLDGISVTIGAGGTGSLGNGGNSEFLGSVSGGSNVIALGGSGGANPSGSLTSGSGAGYNSNISSGANGGFMGYGAGGGSNTQRLSGINNPKQNSGQGSSGTSGSTPSDGGSGYCSIKWYE